MRVAGKTYYIHDEDLAQAEILGLSSSYIRNRLLNDWTVHEAHTAPKGVRLEDYREAQKIEYLQTKARKTREEVKKAKHREAHPWLYDGTPQVHPRGKYVSDLMKYDVFPKVVK
ncbi:SA1788 family PVL leukocidin-associated protein [Staphylococcus nepalensis]|uniref:SA1788 family PVL leukocidin-associated protein n=1 Tax=Staphylococcus nepalensis TaxID=214473 RepID=UPI003CECCA72